MSILLYIFGSVFIVSLISLIGVFTLSMHRDFLKRSVFFLVSLSVGALFGDAIIHLIPETFESFGNTSIAALFILIGIITFFILEKFLHWHHHHDHENHHHETPAIQPIGRIILFSDGIHNFIDGVIIAASYLVSIEVGIATTIAVILHEIPQEIGDFGILIHAGYSRIKALFINFFSALFSFVGVVFVLLLKDVSAQITPALIAIAAGSFLYIAGSDLVPELQKTYDIKKSLLQFFAIAIGIGVMFALVFIE